MKVTLESSEDKFNIISDSESFPEVLAMLAHGACTVLKVIHRDSGSDGSMESLIGEFMSAIYMQLGEGEK